MFIATLTLTTSDLACCCNLTALGKQFTTRFRPTSRIHHPPPPMSDSTAPAGSKHLTAPPSDPDNPLLRAAIARRTKDIAKKTRERTAAENMRAKPDYSGGIDDFCAGLDSLALGAAEAFLKIKIPGVDDIDSAVCHAMAVRRARQTVSGVATESPPKELDLGSAVSERKSQPGSSVRDKRRAVAVEDAGNVAAGNAVAPEVCSCFPSKVSLEANVCRFRGCADRSAVDRGSRSPSEQQIY
jgi:hypothetical protein